MMQRDTRIWITILVLLVIFVFVIRITGPADLEDNSQSRNVGYAMDLVQHDKWLVQHDLQGRILSKPPLHTWLIGVFAVPFGLSRFTLVLPSFLAVLALTLLVFEVGRRRFGMLAGGVAGLSVIMAPMLWRQIAMVRSDTVFTLAIAAGAFAVFQGWEKGRGWVWFWVCGAIAILTKGPLGLLLSAAGLLAWFWENRTHAPATPPQGRQLPGILLFFAICLAWIIPALCFHGQALIDKMIFKELLGHLGPGSDPQDLSNKRSSLLEPTLNFVVKFAPFSLLALCGIYRAIRHAAVNGTERRFERFLVCWILVGLLIFSIASHHRADLLLPLWPAAALLAGREGAVLARRIGNTKSACLATVVCIALLGAAWGRYHPLFGKPLKSTAYSESVREAAEAFRKTGLDPARIHYLEVPTTFQFYLETANSRKLPETILAERDPSGKGMLIATRDTPPDPTVFGMAEIREVFRWPEDPMKPSVIRIFDLSW